MKSPAEIINQRIEHHLEQAKVLNQRFEQCNALLGAEANLTSNRLQSFVNEFTRIETERAANRALLSELEALRIVFEFQAEQAAKSATDPMVRALQSVTPAQARAVWTALQQFIDNSDPDECGGEVDPNRAYAEELQDKLDAAHASLA